MKEKFPPGSCLFVTNHVTPENLLALKKEIGKPSRFYLSQSSFDLLNPHWIKKLDPISEANLDQALEALNRGESLILPAEGALVDWKGLLKLHPKIEALAAHSVVIPVWVGWGGMRFGSAIASQEITIGQVREALYELSAEIYEVRPELQRSLGAACIEGLKQKQSKVVMTDAFQKGRQLKGGMLLAIALTLAQWIRKQLPEPRIGIVLPPGIGTTLVNLAIVLAGKTPVNLNFSAGRVSNEAALRIAEIKSIFTADAFVSKVKDFPWPEQRWDLPSLLKKLGKFSILSRYLLVKVLPAAWIVKWFKISEEGGNKEAALLFTSGSSGEPKGVVLTHRNILGNAMQVKEILELEPDSKLLGCLPIFHSFGFTVTIWYPLCFGPEVVTYISPLNVATLGEVIAKYQVTLAITTPTFLRGYMRRVKPEQLTSLKVILTGAEKLPIDLAEQFESRFHVPVREGYGLTETSPVISTNFAESLEWKKQFPGQTRNRRGSAGPIVAGVGIKVTDPESGRPINLTQTGMIWFKGVNCFQGYLNEPIRSAEMLQNGWLKTGDLGRMDEEGFLYIEGRLSRFSKIAGEMAPHGLIEQCLNEAFESNHHDHHVLFAVTSRPHPEKGEELVALTVLDVTQGDLTHCLHKKGLPNLWVPKVIKRVETIPVLGSGKLDLKKCALLAREKELV